jgi:serine protease Do
MEALRSVVANTKPGMEVDVFLMHDGREERLKVTVGRQPGGEQAQAPTDNTFAQKDLGITVQTLTPNIAQTLGYPADMQGVDVTEIAPNTGAAAAGLMPNDVIVQVGTQRWRPSRISPAALCCANLSVSSIDFARAIPP